MIWGGRRYYYATEVTGDVRHETFSGTTLSLRLPIPTPRSDFSELSRNRGQRSFAALRADTRLEQIASSGRSVRAVESRAGDQRCAPPAGPGAGPPCRGSREASHEPSYVQW